MVSREYYEDWYSDNKEELKAEFIAKYPIDDRPTDDDEQEWFDGHYDAYEDFCQEMFGNYLEDMGRN